MRRIVVVLTALLMAASVAQAADTLPGLDRVAAIQSVAPLQDHSEQSVTTAIKEAVVTAAQQAAAMGLSWIQLREAYVLNDKVIVLVLATDTEPGEQGEQEEESAPRGKLNL